MKPRSSKYTGKVISTLTGDLFKVQCETDGYTSTVKYANLKENLIIRAVKLIMIKRVINLMCWSLLQTPWKFSVTLIVIIVMRILILMYRKIMRTRHYCLQCTIKTSSSVNLSQVMTILQRQHSWKSQKQNKVLTRKKNLKKLYGPFLWMGFNCLKARATSRRQFAFYH